MGKHKKSWAKTTKIVATAVIALVILGVIIGIGLTINQQNTVSSGSNSSKTTSKASTTANNLNNNQSISSRYIPIAATKTSNCHENNGLPDPACTPGATDSRVTQANIKSTICVSGYTTTDRPPTSYTNPLKVKQIQEYGFTDTKVSDYEEDHFIPLEVGGSPTSPANLWPESYNETYGSHQKDKVENYLHEEVCNGSMTLTEAQKEIATDWESVYNNHYGTLTANAPTTTVLAPIVVTPAPTISSGVIKKSTAGICHAPGTTYYDMTTNYTPYDSLDECLKADGRLPKR